MPPAVLEHALLAAADLHDLDQRVGGEPEGVTWKTQIQIRKLIESKLFYIYFYFWEGSVQYTKYWNVCKLKLKVIEIVIVISVFKFNKRKYFTRSWSIKYQYYKIKNSRLTVLLEVERLALRRLHNHALLQLAHQLFALQPVGQVLPVGMQAQALPDIKKDGINLLEVESAWMGPVSRK